MATTAVEKPKTRADIAQLAGKGPLSYVSALAGILVGYATFTLLLAGAVAILRGNDSQLDLSENWGDLSARGGLLLGGLLFCSFLLGGYMAGRMAWRRGAVHGVLMVLGTVLIVGVVAALLRTLTQPEDVEGITDALKSFGVPTTGEEWGNVGAVVWVASAAGIVLGSVLGGMLGERWFSRVSRNALAAEIDVRDRLEASDERLAPIDDGHARIQTETEARGKRDAGDGDGDGDGNGRKAKTIDVDALSKEELYQLAQEEDIPGRSQMTKEELKEALLQQS